MSEQPPDPLPPGEGLAPREPHAPPIVWRPPWLRETPLPNEADDESRGPSEERAAALRALLEFPEERTRARRYLSASLPFLWMVLLGAAVTAGIGVVARTSIPGAISRTTPAASAPQDASPPASGLLVEAGAPVSPGDALPASSSRAEPVSTIDSAARAASVPSERESRAPAASGAEGDEPSNGAIDVRTNAPGVWVEIEGVAQGRAPMRVSGLTAGPYVLRVTRPEGSVSQTVYVVDGEATRILVPGGSPAPSERAGELLAAPADPMPESTSFASLQSSGVELPVFVLEDPPVVPAADAAPAARPAPDGGAASPPEPISERLPPIPAPFPRPDGARIVLDLTIDARGRVQAISIRRSDDLSVNATIASAARGWRYRPARLDGVAVPSVRTVDIPLSVKY